MTNRLAQRMSRVEREMAQRAKEPIVCNCRLETAFHTGNCLEASLNGAARVCALHGFRAFGFFVFAARQYPLNHEDSQLCPCPPHPWRSFVLNGPRSWEAHNAALDACNKLPPTEFNFQEDKRKVDDVLAKYEDECQRWVEKTGRQLATPEEIKKLTSKRAHQHAY